MRELRLLAFWSRHSLCRLMLTKASKIAACLRNLMRLLYTGNYSPPIFFLPFCPCYQQPKSNVFLNTTMSDQIQDWAKPSANVEGWKLHRVNLITLYTDRNTFLIKLKSLGINFEFVYNKDCSVTNSLIMWNNFDVLSWF